jgi:hypothetical protein
MTSTVELQGSGVLPSGATQQFTALTAPPATNLQSQQSDGSTFTWTVPLAPPMFKTPDFSQPATGTYTSPEFNINFTLTSTAVPPDRWTTLLTDFGGGLTGEFSLNPDFSGSGQLLQDGEVIALVSWTRTGEMEVQSLTAESNAASPAGAAMDFLLHRWQQLSALGVPGL